MAAKRLIGAITLGLLAIVFLPMIFDREPKRGGGSLKTQEISVQVPAKEGQPPLAAPSPAQIASQSPSQTPSPAQAPVAAANRQGRAGQTGDRIGCKGGRKRAAQTSAGLQAGQAAASRQAAESGSSTGQEPEKSGFAVQLGVLAGRQRQAGDRQDEGSKTAGVYREHSDQERQRPPASAWGHMRPAKKPMPRWHKSSSPAPMARSCRYNKST